MLNAELNSREIMVINNTKSLINNTKSLIGVGLETSKSYKGTIYVDGEYNDDRFPPV